MINEARLAELFAASPPHSAETSAKHQAVQDAAIACAVTIGSQIDNPAEVTVILRRIKDVAMQAHAAIDYEALGISYRGVFES